MQINIQVVRVSSRYNWLDFNNQGVGMKELKTSEAQRRAIENWAKKNPDAKRYHRNKSNARTYARKYAKTLEEVEELVEIFKKENPNYKK